MRTLPFLAGFVACFFVSLPFGHAAESARLLVTVNKKTLGRAPDKPAAISDRSRTQTLLVSVTNESVRAMPAGVIQWTAVIRKSSSGSLKYSGKKDLPPLPSFKSAEISCGAFDVGSYQSASGVESDRVDYEIAILHDGKETFRTASASNFAVLAEKAESMTKGDGAEGNEGNNQGDRRPRMRRETKPADPAVAGAEKIPAQKPEVPGAEIAPAATLPPPVPQKTFDFFNLGGKTPPAAK